MSRLDGELSEAYGAALRVQLDPEKVKTVQRAWLRDMRNKCQDEACLVGVYEQRIAALEALAAPSKDEVESDDTYIPTDKEPLAGEKREAPSTPQAEVAPAAQATEIAPVVTQAIPPTRSTQPTIATAPTQVVSMSQEEPGDSRVVMSATALLIAVLVVVSYGLFNRRRSNGAARDAGGIKRSTVIIVGSVLLMYGGYLLRPMRSSEKDFQKPVDSLVASANRGLAADKNLPVPDAGYICDRAGVLMFERIRYLEAQNPSRASFEALLHESLAGRGGAQLLERFWRRMAKTVDDDPQGALALVRQNGPEGFLAGIKHACLNEMAKAGVPGAQVNPLPKETNPVQRMRLAVLAARSEACRQMLRSELDAAELMLAGSGFEYANNSTNQVIASAKSQGCLPPDF